MNTKNKKIKREHGTKMCPTLTARKKKGVFTFFLYLLSGNKVLQPNDLKISGLEVEKIIIFNFYMKCGGGLILLTHIQIILVNIN